jgi:hypothetical protein
MFRAVQRRVRAAIHQEPYLGFNALGDVCLAGRSEQPSAATQIAPPAEVKPLTYLQYVEAFETGQPVLRGAPFTTAEMGSLAASVFERGTKTLAGTRWLGGSSWGGIAFDASGRTAQYALGLGGKPGQLLLQGVLGDSGHHAGSTRGVVATEPILLGEWQEGENTGGLILKFGRHEIKVLWGPRFLREETWIRVEDQQGQVAITTAPPPSSRCDGVHLISRPVDSPAASVCQLATSGKKLFCAIDDLRALARHLRTIWRAPVARSTPASASPIAASCLSDASSSVQSTPTVPVDRRYQAGADNVRRSPPIACVASRPWHG